MPVTRRIMQRDELLALATAKLNRQQWGGVELNTTYVDYAIAGDLQRVHTGRLAKVRHRFDSVPTGEGLPDSSRAVPRCLAVEVFVSARGRGGIVNFDMDGQAQAFGHQLVLIGAITDADRRTELIDKLRRVGDRRATDSIGQLDDEQLGKLLRHACSDLEIVQLLRAANGPTS